ncbi:MAG: vanadium-dependent haloperoxidase [Thermoleophilia bacterium]|nr:vanadium-dependent haloperoxidase [Thermoleophilia bacterium]
MTRRLMLVAAILGALAAPAVARADAVTQWNLNAATALMVTAGQGPQVSVPNMAMVHGAVYDAVNAIDGGHQGYLLTPRVARRNDSKEAAAAAAAYRMLLNLVPTQKPALDLLYSSALAGIPDGSAKTRGIAVGELAAAAMIEARTDDGRFGSFRFTVGSLPGQWRPVLPAFVNDPFAWLKDVRPFLLESGTQFTTLGPAPLASRRYAKEFNEVKSIGRATGSTRTPDQTLGARYWAENPPLTWSRVIRNVSAQQNVSLVDNARLFAMAYMTAADSLITVWNEKARWSFWRPITAIREAATDGNPDTAPDPDWLPLIPTPPYTEHPSGHAGLTGSFVTTFQSFFGTDRIGWTDTNNGGLTRSFTRASQALDELVEARIWSGIHFRSADEQSARIARQVSRYRDRHFFQPVVAAEPEDDDDDGLLGG